MAGLFRLASDVAFVISSLHGQGEDGGGDLGEFSVKVCRPNLSVITWHFTNVEISVYLHLIDHFYLGPKI